MPIIHSHMQLINSIIVNVVLNNTNNVGVHFNHWWRRPKKKKKEEVNFIRGHKIKCQFQFYKNKQINKVRT